MDQPLNENEPLNSAPEMEKKDGKPSIFRPICLGLLLACSSNFQIGYSVTFMNAPVVEFRNFFNKSSTDRGYGSMTENHLDWIWSVFLNVWLVGFALGVWLNPYFNDKIGRRKGFLYMSLLNLFASCLRFYGIRSEIYECLILGQFVAALSTSVTYQSLILMLQESSPTKLRGLLSCLSEVSVALFAVFGTFIGMDFIFGSNLNLLVGCAIIPGIIGVLILIPMHETPKFLLLFKHDKAAAIRSIQFYHGKTADAGDVIEEIKKEGEQESKSSSFMELFRIPHLRKAVVLGIITLQLTCALWIVFFLSTYFLIQVHIDSHFAGWTSTMLVCLYLIGTCFGSAFVDKFGRRKMLLLGLQLSSRTKD